MVRVSDGLEASLSSTGGPATSHHAAAGPADSLPIVADVPTANPGLGFPEYAAALADAVRGGEPPQFTIGLYGAWGSGKSSLLNAIATSLSVPQSNVVPVLFDAWRYERAEHIVVPLLHRICDEVAASGDTDLLKTLRRALGALVLSLKFSLHNVSIDAKAAKQAWDESGITALDQAFSQPFRELAEVPKALKGRRIAVLIDDLDRCSPANVVSVLEAINLVMDVPGFIFILALDYDVLIEAVSKKYPHVSGHAFVEKMVQLPFRVPPLDAGAGGFLESLVPSWGLLATQLPKQFIAFASEIAELGLRGNPRQIKRYVNSFLVIDRIIQGRQLTIDYEALAAVIALQLGWPDDHRRLQDAVFVGEERPLDTLKARAQEEPVLRRFVERFFVADHQLDELRTLLQLSAVVATNPAQPDDAGRLKPLPGPAEEIRKQNRARLIETLQEHGFSARDGSAEYYSRANAPRIRFVLKTHRLRHERRAATGWSLKKSFLLTREFDEAATAIKTSRARAKG